MNNLVISGTEYTAAVKFDASTGVLEISGSSYPENAMEFYQPLIQWIEQYFSELPARVSRAALALHLRLDYINTSSSKCILDMLYELERHHKQGQAIQVYWHYQADDEDMLATGKEFTEDIGLEFIMAPEKS